MTQKPRSTKRFRRLCATNLGKPRGKACQERKMRLLLAETGATSTAREEEEDKGEKRDVVEDRVDLEMKVAGGVKERETLLGLAALDRSWKR
jgi:hypothetical protein